METIEATGMKTANLAEAGQTERAKPPRSLGGLWSFLWPLLVLPLLLVPCVAIWWWLLSGLWSLAF